MKKLILQIVKKLGEAQATFLLGLLLIKQNFPILVRVTSKALNVTKSYRLDLSFQMPSEIGYAQGSPIDDGDTIEISNNNYEPKSVTFHQPQNQ